MKTPAAFCNLHEFKLTWRQVKVHGCINPRKQRRGRHQCRYFKKNDDHPIWEERERVKARRMGNERGEAIESAAVN